MYYFNRSTFSTFFMAFYTPWIFFFKSGQYVLCYFTKDTSSTFYGTSKNTVIFWCNYSTKWCCRTRILLDVTLYFLQQRFYSTAESLRDFYSGVWFSSLWMRVSTLALSLLCLGFVDLWFIGTREEKKRKRIKVTVVFSWEALDLSFSIFLKEMKTFLLGGGDRLALI